MREIYLFIARKAWVNIPTKEDFNCIGQTKCYIKTDCQKCCHSSSCGPVLLQLKICKKQIYVNTWMTLQCKNNLNLNWVSNIFSWFGKNLKSCGRILLQPLAICVIVMSILLDDTNISRNPFGYNYNVNFTRWYKHLQNSFWI